MLSRSSSYFFASLALFTVVNAHGTINQIAGGAKGAATAAFAVSNLADPVRNDVAVIPKGSKGCGSNGSGVVNIAAGISAAEAAGLPSVDANGLLNMNWRQLNAGSDGGGPGTCEIDTSGTGNNFVACTITKNFADNGANSDNPMQIQLPLTTACNGGSGKTCIIRVTNPAGPFGGCFAVASPAGGNAAVVGGAASSPTTSGAAVAAQSTTTTTAAAVVTTTSSAVVTSSTTTSSTAVTTSAASSSTSVGTDDVVTVTITAPCSAATTSAASNVAAVGGKAGKGKKHHGKARTLQKVVAKRGRNGNRLPAIH